MPTIPTQTGSPAVSLGIDVGGPRKGYHCVALDEFRQVVGSPLNLKIPRHLARLVAELQPETVAIDAPAGWSETGKSREAERVLARMGMRSFCTPSRIRAQQNLGFYGWMFQGEQAFEAIASTHPGFDGEPAVVGRSMEVFPQATVFRLAGQAKPTAVSKSVWRRQLLQHQGIDSTQLTNLDLVDAALCALTGLLALAGDFQAVGNRAEGFLVLPRGGA